MIIAPHTAAISPHEPRMITELFAENARRLLDGEELLNRGRHGRVLLRAPGSVSGASDQPPPPRTSSAV